MADVDQRVPGRMPTYFLSHGGGPWPWMDGDYRLRHRRLAGSLQALPAELPRTPAAVLMVSAHWEEPAFTAMSADHPGMLYDYYGFPAHTYEVRYPAPGLPPLAERVTDLLLGAGLPVARDSSRGFDHGAFVPMSMIFPDASVPMIQLSLRTGLDPAEHVAMGRALAPLRDDGVLILGSGLSYHNLRLLGPAGGPASAAFDAWLQAVLVEQTPGRSRSQALLEWHRAPGARQAHPREEHLLPLMVVLGAAEADEATCCYHETDFAGGLTVSSFRFGAGS